MRAPVDILPEVGGYLSQAFEKGLNIHTSDGLILTCHILKHRIDIDAVRLNGYIILSLMYIERGGLLTTANVHTIPHIQHCT